MATFQRKQTTVQAFQWHTGDQPLYDGMGNLIAIEDGEYATRDTLTGEIEVFPQHWFESLFEPIPDGEALTPATPDTSVPAVAVPPTPVTEVAPPAPSPAPATPVTDVSSSAPSPDPFAAPSPSQTSPQPSEPSGTTGVSDGGVSADPFAAPPSSN